MHVLLIHTFDLIIKITSTQTDLKTKSWLNYLKLSC